MFRITGVVNTGYDYGRYAILDKSVDSDDALGYYILQNQFDSERGSAFSGMLFGGANFIEEYLAYKGVGGEITDKASLEFKEINGKTYGMYMGGNYSRYFTKSDYSDVAYFENGKTALYENEIALGVNAVVSALENVYYSDEAVMESLRSLIIEKTNQSEIINTLKPLLDGAKIKMSCGGSFSAYFTEIVSVKGFFFDDGDVDGSFIGMSDELATRLKSVPTGKYQMAVSGEKISKTDLEKIVDFSMKSENGVKYSLVNYVVSVENMIGSLIKSVAKILLYVGIGVFVFAVILFMSYISASVSYKKREIGILRAVGARSSDVFGVFFNEALVIALIVFALATIGSGVSVAVTNSALRSSYGLPITLLSYGIREAGIILLGCVVTALFASFIPVLKIARKKPVDAIKNR